MSMSMFTLSRSGGRHAENIRHPFMKEISMASMDSSPALEFDCLTSHETLYKRPGNLIYLVATEKRKYDLKHHGPKPIKLKYWRRTALCCEFYPGRYHIVYSRTLISFCAPFLQLLSEVQEMIFSYLYQEEQIALTKSSRNLHAIVEPLLYRDIGFGWRQPPL